MNETARHTGFGVIAQVMWSFTMLLLALLQRLPPFEILSCAFFGGFALMTAAQIYNREDIKSYWRRPIGNYAFWLAGPGVYTILLYLALTYSPVFEVNALNYIWPIMLVIFSSLVARRSLSPSAIIGIAAGFLGCIFVIIPAGGFNSHSLQFGRILALVAGVTWAGYSALTYKTSYPDGFLAAAFCVFSMICLTLHLAFEKTVWPNLFETVILCALAGTRISYSLWDRAMKRGDVILLASLSYFLPLASTLWLLPFGFAPHRPMIGLGAALIVLGCLSVNAGRILKLARREKPA